MLTFTHHKKYFVAALVALLAIGVYWYYNPPVFSKLVFSPNKVVAQVGNTPLVGRDVVLRIRAMRVFDPATDEKSAADQLIQGHTFHEILKTKSGAELQNALDEEIKRVEAVPNPAWDRAKSFFGKDQSALNKVLVVPALMDRLIYTEGYLKDSDYHKKERAEAETVLKQGVQSPALLKDLASQRRKDWLEGSFDNNRGLVWKNSAKAQSLKVPDGLLVTQQWNTAFFKDLKVGQVANQLVDAGSLWLVVKKGPEDAQKPGAYKIEVIAFPKKPFLKWLEENRAKIPTKRYGLTSGG